eukprot:TRINITY_DN4262_c0_g1_i1.p1 TRINITY_DN4262_c0_g1~~TRINITY_DN4262_c0_g1_i1.p1  ORF type:complete len:590 (+),score=128.31 TRINITY_DN4262_c0_g1_i1:744-2513(+)
MALVQGLRGAVRRRGLAIAGGKAGSFVHPGFLSAGGNGGRQQDEQESSIGGLRCTSDGNCGPTLEGITLIGPGRRNLVDESPAATWQLSSGVRRYSSTNPYVRERSYARDALEYNQVMLALIRNRRSFFLRDAYDDMLMDGVAPNRDTFHIVIPASMRMQRLQDAFYFFNQMKAHGMLPDVVLYNCLISTCGRCLQVDRAFQVAEEMESMGISPKQRTFVALLNACGQAGRVNEAHGVIQRMTVYGLTMNRFCYSALITAYKNRRPLLHDTANKIFELLEESRRKGDEEDKMMGRTLGDGESDEEIEDEQNAMLMGLATPGGGTWGAFGPMARKNPGVRALAVHHAAMRALVDLRNNEGALKVVRMIEEEGMRPDAFIYHQLMKAHLAMNHLDRAVEALEAYLAVAPASLDVYLTMIEGAILKYNAEGMAIAKRLLMEMESKGFWLNTKWGGHLLTIASKERLGDFSVASLIFEMLLKNKNMRPPLGGALAFLRGLLNRGTPESDPRVQMARKICSTQTPPGLRSAGQNAYGTTRGDAARPSADGGDAQEMSREEGEAWDEEEGSERGGDEEEERSDEHGNEGKVPILA